MTVLWLVAAASLLIAVAAWVHARRTAKRLEHLAEMYWELKYQYSELRAEARAREGDREPRTGGAPTDPAAPSGGFVPFTSLKR